MASKNLVKIGSGNGLLLGGTKPLPEPNFDMHDIYSMLVAISPMPC